MFSDKFDLKLVSGKNQPVPLCLHVGQKGLPLEELLENEGKVITLSIVVEKLAKVTDFVV